MPWHIEKSGSKFKVVKDSDGKVVGTHDTRDKAKKQLSALNANVEESMRLKIEERRPTGVFRESKPKSGNREAVLIEAGWGSSGYYSEEVLDEYGPKAWPVGTHMHLDHPTMQEDIEKPEGSVKDWVGVVAAPPRMAGIQLVSEVEVFDHWKPVIDSIAPHVGLSVMAPGVFEDGSAAGKQGPIITEIHSHELNRVDYVTLAGAGGKVGQLVESARSHQVREVLDSNLRDHLRDVGTEKWGARDVYVYVDDYDSDAGYAIFCVSPDNDESVYYKMAYDLSGDNAADLTLTGDPQKVERTTSYQPIKEAANGGKRKENKMETEELQRKLSEAESKLKTAEEDLKESDTKLKEATKERDELKDRADRADDALLLSGAKTIAREAIDKIDGLPERAQDRAVEAAVRGDLPKDESGKLITEKVKENALAKAREELEYLAGETLEGDLPLKESSNGSSPSPTTTTTTTTNGGGDAEKQLVESFVASGMSEDAAKIAAKGR